MVLCSHYRVHSKKVMDTVKYVRENSSQSSTRSRIMSSGSSCQESLFDAASEVGGASESESESAKVSATPGAHDLATALRRLATRKANELNDRMIQQHEIDKLKRRVRSVFLPLLII